MDIREATRRYERWMAAHLPVVVSDLRLKHERMRENAFVFLRGTFYRWMQQWPTTCASLADAPRVLAVGDLHLENFGTWRDSEGRLVWGVNDVDEACALPYAVDLVRLATSAILAAHQGHLALSVRDICATILNGYGASLERGGRPIVLAERRRWLRDIALNELRDPAAYWPKLEDVPSVTRNVPHDALRRSLPDPRLRYRVGRRVAGVGSLGRPRFVALTEWGGAHIAREAKAWLPSAAEWARGRPSGSAHGATLLKRAVRAPDPFFAIDEGWVVRRLAPDCSRIELSDLPGKRDEEKLLRVMGWETANLHLGTPRRAVVRAHLRSRPKRWLDEAAMAETVDADWRAWVNG